MLDDLKYIHQRDAQDALGIAEKQSNQLQQEFRIPNSEFRIPNCQNIVFAGMGGSALAGLISQVWPAYPIPFEICRGYQIPKYVSDKTLFITSSYSGNTEETLAALAEAQQRQAAIAVLASGGKLALVAKTKGYPLLLLPAGLQPRYATFYSFKALVSLLDSLGLTQNGANELAGCEAYIANSVVGWRPDIPANDNLAKQIAQDIVGKSAVVYSGPLMFPAAYKWKISINENAKNIAWCNQYSELNHNEFLGWTSHPIQKPYAVVELRSSFEHPRIQKRFEVTDRLLSGKRPSPIVVNALGDTLLKQLLWTVALGDFVSLYLAILNGLNPTPVELIEKLKQAMTE